MESQILLVDRLGYIRKTDTKLMHDKIAEIERMLDSLIRSLKKRVKGVEG